MKKYLKKVSIIFFILLAIIGIQSIQSGTIANAATIGEKLLQPEDGWTRYDDADTRILYSSGWGAQSGFDSSLVYNGTRHYSMGDNAGLTIKFKFYGTKLRVINPKGSFYSGANVKIDGIDYGNFCSYSTDVGNYILCFEKLDLTKTIHDVVITTVDKNNFVPKPNYTGIVFDAIDIDSTGNLLPYTDVQPVVASGISLNKTTDSLQVGQTDNLVATITPDNATNKNVTWSSSDTTVATVDSNGKVTAIKAGTANVTATTTDGSNLSATCAVTVTDSSINKSNLTLHMMNGDVLKYNLSEKELNDFLSWHDAKSKGTALSYYIFVIKSGDGATKRQYVEYDKIVYFDIE